jgi:actin-like ATPase involved in cell morphogenesis
MGTVNTRIYSRDRGVVVNEPSAVALDDRTGEVQAVRTETKHIDRQIYPLVNPRGDDGNRSG